MDAGEEKGTPEVHSQPQAVIFFQWNTIFAAELLKPTSK